jgi:hypothetical protein
VSRVIRLAVLSGGIVECCHRISIQSLELCSKHQKGSASAQGQGFELPRGRRPSLRREAFDFVPDRMAKENNLSISWNAASVRARSPVASKSNCNPRTAANPKVAKACAWSLATERKHSYVVPPLKYKNSARDKRANLQENRGDPDSPAIAAIRSELYGCCKNYITRGLKKNSD